MLPRMALQDRHKQKPLVIEINAEPTPLTREGVSDSFIQGKTGVILPKIVQELKRLKRG